MGVILDTNALSATADDAPGITEALAKAESAAIPVIVLGEYRFGVLQSRRRVELEAWVQKHLPAFRVLEITEATSHYYAELRVELKHAGTPIPSNDVWIAALSREHRMPVLSRDRHFDLVTGLRRLKW
jgi:tRNA(fMet)-specific endonuclease VapC